MKRTCSICSAHHSGLWKTFTRETMNRKLSLIEDNSCSSFCPGRIYLNLLHIEVQVSWIIAMPDNYLP